jgi:hypothetical protein
MEGALPKLDLDTIPQTNATGYPPEYAEAVQERWYRRLAPSATDCHYPDIDMHLFEGTGFRRKDGAEF